MEYLIKTLDSKRLVLVKEDQEIANLNYKGWDIIKSEIRADNGEVFTFENKGFWKTQVELMQNDKVVLDYTLSWKGHFIIHSKLNNPALDFTFKNKGFWGKSYVLLNEKGTELVEITPNFTWKTCKNHYTIQTTPDFDKLHHQDVLMLLLVHCIRYYMAMVVVVT